MLVNRVAIENWDIFRKVAIGNWDFLRKVAIGNRNFLVLWNKKGDLMKNSCYIW